MRKRTSLAGLAGDFDSVEGASKIADEPAQGTPHMASVPEAAEAPPEPTVAAEPATEPRAPQERPRKAARADKTSSVDEALERLARSKPSEYLNARVPRYLDDEIDAAFQAEKGVRRDAADPDELYRALTKQAFVAELLVLGLASHRARSQRT